MPFVLALDQGTTSSRAIVFDETGAPRAVAQREFRQIFPRASWVEHDPEEIWSSQIAVAREALLSAKLAPREIAAIGITNQRETTIVWERSTGRPIANAIVWQDRRTTPVCDRLRAEGAEAAVRAATGLVLDPYFSGTKVAWLLDEVKGARDRAEAGELAFGTVDAWLVWKLTSGKAHVTDPSNASRTLLFDLKHLDWSDEMLRRFRVPRAILPQVRPSSEVVATAEVEGLAGIPIAGIAGDQQAALFGQRCFLPGAAKTTYGTGCFALRNAGTAPPGPGPGILASVGWSRGGVTTYVLEGSVFIGGAVVQWLRDGLGVIKSSQEVEALAASVPDTGGVCFVPAFAGLGAPHWDARARGLIVGITRGTTAGHIARAALESIAFQVADLLAAMAAGAKASDELRVDGGASRNDALMQLQADLLGVTVVRPEVTETTALGAAFLAGLATGVWTRPEDLPAPATTTRFTPRMPREEAARRRARWALAVERAKGWDREEGA